MSATTQTVTTNKTDVCPVATAETVVCANKAARKMLLQEQKKKTDSLNTFQILINVSDAEFVQDFALAESGKWKPTGVNSANQGKLG